MRILAKIFSLISIIVMMSVCDLHAQAIGENYLMLSRLGIRHREHKGVGYDQGYSTVALFACPKRGFIGLPFVDGRAHVFNNEDLAANLGAGIRFSNREQTYLVGFNTFYDYRNVKWLNTHQLSAGIEILSHGMDFRINGYYPLLGKYQDDPLRFHGFEGHHMMVKHKVRYALPCVDAELGWTLPEPFDQIGLYFGLGGYYLFRQKGLYHQVGDVPGVKGRLTANLSSYFSLGVEYTYDKLFRSRASGVIALNIPLGRNRARSAVVGSGVSDPVKNTQWLAIQTQDVVRNEIIPIARKTHRFCHGYAAGAPMEFVFVNNQKLSSTGVGEGDGTFEHPYTTLTLATEHSREKEILYVFAGDGTSRGYDEGVILQPGQTLVSAAASWEIHGINIPALTPERYPHLTADHGPVIQVMGPGVQVRGFRIEGGDDHAIYVEGGGITLTQNHITAAKDCSAFKEAGGEVGKSSSLRSLLQDNHFVGQGGFAPVVDLEYAEGTYVLIDNHLLAVDGQQGVRVYHPQGETYLERNHLQATDPSGTALVYHIAETPSHMQHRCIGNTVSEGFYEAMRIEHYDGTLEVKENAYISETLGRGITYENCGKQGEVTFESNKVLSSGEGIYISDTTEADSSINILGNRLKISSAMPAIHAEFAGVTQTVIEENQIDYFPNLEGAFSGIFSRLKNQYVTHQYVTRDPVTHQNMPYQDQDTSLVVVKNNIVVMPSDQLDVSVINERVPLGGKNLQ